MSTQRQRKLESRLTLQQRNAALLCVERELGVPSNQKSFAEIGAEIGVTERTWYNWRTGNKDFIAYVNLIADVFLESKRSIVYRKMMELIESKQPSVKAMDLYLRRHGLLTDRQVVENTNSDSNKSNDDIEKEIAELDELLTSEEDE
jgi:hypothetical protein